MKPILKIIAFVLMAGILFHISCKKEYSCEGCIGGNKPPIANAGPDQTILLPTDSVTLDGSASSDPDGTISSFQWIKISGPASFTINSSAATRTVVKNLGAGTYQFELKVTDNSGLSAKDTMRVIVDAVVTTNHSPVANAGADQTITLPVNTVTLDGSGSTDPDNNITSYAWTKISGPSSFNIANANTVQTPVTNLTQGVYLFELKVTDAGGLFSKDTMQVIVNPASPTNLSPIANAGTDISVNYDLQTCSFIPATVTLNGSASTDPDGTIVTYFWTQTGGQAGTITNPDAVISTIIDIPFSGSYSIELTVTDNLGAIDKDTVLLNIVGINRPAIPAQLQPFGTLSQTRWSVSIAAAGNKILFAGGYIVGLSTPSSRVDIYDIVSNTWTTAELSQPRSGMAVTVLGNKIFFGGGYIDSYNTLSSRIDIYDVISGIWSTAELSLARVWLTAAQAGNKVLFAGGFYQITGQGDFLFSNKVDIYDASANSWSTSSLSQARGAFTATTVGNKIYFAGGITLFNPNDIEATTQIDIFDAISGSWSTSSLSEAKGDHAAISVNNKIYWAGGKPATQPIYPYVSNLVEIRDVNTPSSLFACLFQPNASLQAVLKDNKIVFFTGEGAIQNKFDIYDITTNAWSIGALNHNIFSAAIISVNNTIYVAGGYINGVLSNQVWKLNF